MLKKMLEEHIIVIDDEEPICNAISQKLDNLLGDRYIVSKFLDAKDAIDFIEDYIEMESDVLAMAISDQRLNGMQGHEFIRYLSKTHPMSIKILNTAYSDFDPIREATNYGIDAVTKKLDKDFQGDELFDTVQREIETYNTEAKLRLEKKGIVFAQADTLYQKKQFLKLRYDVYLEEGHKTKEMFRSEEIENGMEWDDYDVGDIDSMQINNKVRYIVAMKEGICVGGVRIIDGKLPLEEGICIGDDEYFKKGEGLSLEKLARIYPNDEIYNREISRLIVHPEHREGGTVLFGLFRFLEQITRREPTMMCTARPNTISLYQAVGFERFAPDIKYSLANEWTPLIRFWWKAHHEPDKIPGMSTGLHKMVTKPLSPEDERSWSEYSKNLQEKAIRTGYYVD